MPRATEAEIVFPFCSVAELERAGKITRFVEELRDEISAFSRKGDIHVISSICPHFGGELALCPSEGQLRCNWHGYRYDLVSGKCLNLPIATRLRKYEFRVAGDVLEILAR